MTAPEELSEATDQAIAHLRKLAERTTSHDVHVALLAAASAMSTLTAEIREIRSSEPLPEPEGAAQVASDSVVAEQRAASIDWEQLPVPTNYEIADHLRAGGKIVMATSEGWIPDPCHCSWPEGWTGSAQNPRPVSPIPHYRLVPQADA
jgi:hypothetical protein